MSHEKPMPLALLLTPIGTHAASWRHPEADTERTTDLSYFQGIAQAAEAACYDLLFIADTLYLDTVGPAIERRFPRHAHVTFDPLLLLSALAPLTSRIGLAATVSTTYSTPFATARAISSLDHLTSGRAGWNVVTSQSNLEARNYGGGQHAVHADRYRKAGEFVDVVTRLWDSWEEDALVADKASGVAIDPARLHLVQHEGEHYSVAGPLVIPRSPQGRPVVIQAGSSGPGQDLAAATADIVFTAQDEKANGIAFYRSIKGRLAANGRSEDELVVMTGVNAIVGATDAEAQAKFQALQDLVDPQVGLALLANILHDPDVLGFDVDKPLPPLADTNASQSRLEAIRRMGADGTMTVRDIYTRLAPGRGHLMLVGSAEKVADTLLEWRRDGATDGFMLVPSLMPQSQADFDAMVLPILRDRGVVRDGYDGATLREHLGLARPANRFHSVGGD